MWREKTCAQESSANVGAKQDYFSRIAVQIVHKYVMNSQTKFGYAKFGLT